MKRRLKTSSPLVRKTLVRDAHVPDTVHVVTETNDAPALAANARIRSAGLLKRGQRFRPIDDHAELTVQFQFPTVTDYMLARATYPDIFAELELGGDHAIRAGDRLALLLPQYVTTIYSRNRIAMPGDTHAG